MVGGLTSTSASYLLTWTPSVDFPQNQNRFHRLYTLKFNIHQMAKEGTKENPWKLKTPPLTSEYEMYRDEKEGKEVIVCVVGKTTLLYDYRCLSDLHHMLKKHGDWMELGSADEQKPAKEGTVEAWGRSNKNPVGGWYGLKKGLRGRFGMYIPPLMEKLGLAEVTHEPRGNKMKAK
jgi:hypothetical protein